MGVRHGGIIDFRESRVAPRRGKRKRKGKASFVAQKASMKSRVSLAEERRSLTGLLPSSSKESVPYRAFAEWLAR